MFGLTAAVSDGYKFGITAAVIDAYRFGFTAIIDGCRIGTVVIDRISDISS